MKLRFTSGQICNIFGISKQTLFFYDKIGLICPDHKDPGNGYRYYTFAQFDLLYLILSLRETGMPLQQIKQLLSQRTVTTTMTTLQQQVTELDIKITALQTAKSNLQKKLGQTEYLSKLNPHTKFVIKAAANQHLLVMPATYINNKADLNSTLTKLTRHMAENAIPFYWNIGYITQLTAPATESLFITLDDYIDDPYLQIKPAGSYLYTYHYGSYATLEQTYQQLSNYILNNKLSTQANIYETYLISDLATADENSYLTELSVAIN